MSRTSRIAGLFAAGVLVLVVVAVGSVYTLSDRAFNREYAVEPAALVPGGAGTNGTNGHLAEWGDHLAHIRGCADCHGEDGGGKEFFSDPPMAVLWASNLTAGEGGIGGSYTDGDWDRAVRHGIGPDDRPLMFMPSHEFWPLSDDDLAALIAHYRGLPAVDRETPDPEIGPLGRVLYLTGQIPLVPAELIDHEAVRPPAPPVGPTVEYGAYLVTGCTGCHGPGLSGGRIPGGDPNWPPAKNITPDDATGIGGWSFDDLDTALRTGVRPNGSTLHPLMPIQATRHLTDVEMEALYAYLTSLEPRPYGNR